MITNKIDYSVIFNYWQQLLGRYCWKLGFSCYEVYENKYKFEPIVYHQSYDTRHFNDTQWFDPSTKIPTWLGWECLLPRDKIECRRLNNYYLEHPEKHNVFIAKLSSRPNKQDFIQIEELASKKMLGLKLKVLKQMVIEDLADCATHGWTVYAKLHRVTDGKLEYYNINLIHANESLEELMIKIALTA